VEKGYISRYGKTASPEHQVRVYQVGKGYISRFYKTMSPEDQRVYNRWLMGNAIVGSVLAMGLVAMVVAGINSTPSPTVANSKNPNVIAGEISAQSYISLPRHSPYARERTQK
jgi:hypothetical protein